MSEYSHEETQEFERPDPPQVDAMLISIISKARRKPKMFPVNMLDAAIYWKSKQEPPNEATERVEWQSAPKHREGGFWRSPYIDRVAFSLQKFLSMDSPRQFFIIENIDKGCAWRGDGIGFYRRVIEETAKMKEMGKDEYIGNAIKEARKVGVNIPQ